MRTLVKQMQNQLECCYQEDHSTRGTAKIEEHSEWKHVGIWIKLLRNDLKWIFFESRWCWSLLGGSATGCKSKDLVKRGKQCHWLHWQVEVKSCSSRRKMMAWSITEMLHRVMALLSGEDTSDGVTYVWLRCSWDMPYFTFCHALLRIPNKTSPSAASKCPRHLRAFVQTGSSPEWISGVLQRLCYMTVWQDKNLHLIDIPI